MRSSHACDFWERSPRVRKKPHQVRRERLNLPAKTKEEVKERDGRRCRVCGCKTHLEVHHIDPYADDPNAPSNLITLCRACHAAVTVVQRLSPKLYYGVVAPHLRGLVDSKGVAASG